MSKENMKEIKCEFTECLANSYGVCKCKSRNAGECKCPVVGSDPKEEGGSDAGN